MRINNRLNPKLARQLRRTLRNLGYKPSSRGFILATQAQDAENLESREQWEELTTDAERDADNIEQSF